MELKLNFNIESNGLDLTHEDSIVSIGSCFSEEMTTKLVYSGFHVEGNSFGTLFHPEAISNVIQSSINDSNEIDFINRDGLFFSWDTSSAVFGYSENELVENIGRQRAKFKSKLSKAKLLVITVGTAWGYRHTESNIIVGNCHKMNSDSFKKELQTIPEMKAQWIKTINDIQQFNPGLKVLFTVSPVRHKKDGLVANNQSKSRLLELVHFIVEDFDDCFYFPAYEIMIDELRDYRFYSRDLVHPNQIAIDYIWESFKNSSLSEKAKSIVAKINQIKTSLRHKSLHPNSKQDIQRIQKTKLDQEELIKTHPEIYWV